MAMAVVDYLGAFFNATFLLIAALTILLSASYVRREGERWRVLCVDPLCHHRFYVCRRGGGPDHGLSGHRNPLDCHVHPGWSAARGPPLTGSGVQILCAGVLSSAFFLYGIATIYGALGNTNLVHIAQALGQGDVSPLLLMGMALLIVGLGFKVAVVPFHMWARTSTRVPPPPSRPS